MTMGRAILKACLICVVASAGLAQAAIEFIWSPLFDRNAGSVHLDNILRSQTGETMNLPDVTIYTKAEFETKLPDGIAAALAKAWSRGVRVIDLPFTYGGNVWDRTKSMWGNHQVNGAAWIAAIEKYNKPKAAADRFRLRIRFEARAQTLFVYTYEYLPNRTGRGLGTVSGLPTVEAGFGAWTADGLPSAYIPDLANPKIREAIGVYAVNIFDEARALTPSTAIEGMTLVWDAGGETSLLSDPNAKPKPELVPYGFRNRIPYFHPAKVEERMEWMRNRTTQVNLTLKAFAAKIHTRKTLPGGATTAKAGIFYQAWPGDHIVRGTFELQHLLDGTGIDMVHHSMPPTQLPLFTGDPNVRMTTQGDAAIQSTEIGSFMQIHKLKGGSSFSWDTEYSWPWYEEDGTESFIYDSWMIRDAKATAFRNQALGAIKYGAIASTFCNWTRYDMEKGLFRPNTNGEKFPTDNLNSAEFDKILSSAGKTALGNTAPLGAAKKAIYFSTAGRMLLELRASQLAIPTDDPDFPAFKYYRNWFTDFNINPYNERVDIITDKLLIKYPTLLSDYTEIYFPYETSWQVDWATFKVLEAATAANKAKIRFQMQRHATLTQLNLYETWRSKVYVQVDRPSFRAGILY